MLASAGTLLVWAPVVLMLAIAGLRPVQPGGAHLDWLIPVELFPAVLIGGGLIFTGAWRVRWRVRVVGWTLGLMLVSLASSMFLAVVTGLVSGRTEPTGASLVLVSGTMALYGVGLVAIGVAGVVLLTRLFGRASVRPPVPGEPQP